MRLSVGDSVRVYSAWVADCEASADSHPATAGAALTSGPAGDELVQDVVLKASDDARRMCRGEFATSEAGAPGVLWLCVDNSSSWWRAKSVVVSVLYDNATGNAKSEESDLPAVPADLD